MPNIRRFFFCKFYLKKRGLLSRLFSRTRQLHIIYNIRYSFQMERVSPKESFTLLVVCRLTVSRLASFLKSVQVFRKTKFESISQHRLQKQIGVLIMCKTAKTCWCHRWLGAQLSNIQFSMVDFFAHFCEHLYPKRMHLLLTQKGTRV